MQHHYRSVYLSIYLFIYSLLIYLFIVKWIKLCVTPELWHVHVCIFSVTPSGRYVSSSVWNVTDTFLRGTTDPEHRNAVTLVSQNLTYLMCPSPYRLFTPELFEMFIDIGHYVRDLTAYEPLQEKINQLSVRRLTTSLTFPDPPGCWG